MRTLLEKIHQLLGLIRVKCSRDACGGYYYHETNAEASHTDQPVSMSSGETGPVLWSSSPPLAPLDGV